MQRLQEQPELRRKFTIDHDLGRRSKALQHLRALDAFDELKTYVEKHELYSQALDIYRYDSNSLNELTKLYADFLFSRNQFKEAGIAYEYLSDYASASTAYRSANLWRESLSSASLIPLPSSELTNLAQLLADGLIESKDFSSAATIHLDYLSDVETAARLLCRGHWYGEAIRIIGLHHQASLLSSIIDPGLTDGLSTTTELLADCKSQLGAQLPRLREVRAKKAADPLAFIEGVDPAATAEIPDNASIAPTDASTTAGTFLTRYTGKTTGTLATGVSRRSSKNRRREERKRAAGKKGSIYEEEYLANSIRRLIERINGVGEEVERLVEGLMRRGMRERARAVEDAMVEVVGACRDCVDEVFEVEDKKQSSPEALREGDAGYRPTRGEGVVWEAMEQPWKRQEPPVVINFQRLSLIG